jgi:adenine-specific DNA-methyltransferase
MSTLNEQYSQLTIDLTNSLTKEEKKSNGIFITPKIIIKKLFENVMRVIFEHELILENILEPSCGTCEFINYCDEKLIGVNIDGIELNEKIYNAVKDLQYNNKVTIKNEDFMCYNTEKKYNLIVGNPPYFVCKRDNIPKDYDIFINGRPNIFGLFIVRAISMLDNDGLLAFVVPKSFLNSIYYSKIRNYIKETCIIHSIEDYASINNFIETEQATFGLIIQKKHRTFIDSIKDNCKYSLLLKGNHIFTENVDSLKELFDSSTTIENMGLKVRTGKIVWNEHKSQLTDDEKETILIYNTNISKSNQFVAKNFKNDEKKQYIKQDGYIDPVLVVNRGNGNSNYKLNYAIIEKGPYLVENHLNEIYSPKKMEKTELMKKYDIITKSFQNIKTKKFIDLFLGNNSLSKSELESIFPIYL